MVRYSTRSVCAVTLSGFTLAIRSSGLRRFGMQPSAQGREAPFGAVLAPQQQLLAERGQVLGEEAERMFLADLDGSREVTL